MSLFLDILEVAATTLVLAAVARRLGWGDGASDATSARKLQRSPVPPVGGLAILVAHHFYVYPGMGWPRWLLLGALAVGILDDLLPRGLSPRAKLALQVTVVSWAASTVFADWGEIALLAAWAVACMNVANTFDNADGALAAVAAVGLAFTAPALTALPLGFLVFNLDAGASWRRGSGVPTAYLGDSGAYVLGLLLLVHGALPALWIPLLDILRLAVVRWRVGSRPWIGDRRHLAHRLQALGLHPIAVAAVLAAMTVPACLGFHLSGLFPGVSVLGLALGALIFGLAVRLTPASQ